MEETSFQGARADKAEAELAALKGQGPQTPMQLAAAAVRAVCGLGPNADAEAETVRELAMRLKNYAKTHIPREQHEAEMERMQVETQKQERAECSRSHPHEYMTPMCELRTRIARLENAAAHHEAALAQARREGLREALEAVCATGEGEASRANTAIRRALAEKGGEVGKP